MDELQRILESKRLSQGIDPRTGIAFETREKQIMVKSPVLDWKRMPESREKYNAYLASREWAVLKEQVRARSGGKCERCHWAAGEQVHHQTYERKYRELLSDLLHVCRPCHEFVSGKINEDPAMNTPTMLGENVLASVYLAGKISGTTWRDEIAYDWSRANHGLASGQLWGKWEPQHDAISTLKKHSIALTGPWWFDMWGGHGVSTENDGSHCMANNWKHEQPIVNREFVVEQIRLAINRAQLLFAWIDSSDCYGTLVEIGFAGDCMTEVAVYFDETKDLGELWLAKQFARYSGTAKSAGEAWHKFLKDHTK